MKSNRAVTVEVIKCWISSLLTMVISPLPLCRARLSEDVVKYPKCLVWPQGRNTISVHLLSILLICLLVVDPPILPSLHICLLLYSSSTLFSISCCFNSLFFLIPSAFLLCLFTILSLSLSNYLCPLLSTFPWDSVVTSLSYGQSSRLRSCNSFRLQLNLWLTAFREGVRIIGARGERRGGVCWRLQPSAQAINDFEDKPLSSVSDPGLCIFFLVTPFNFISVTCFVYEAVSTGMLLWSFSFFPFILIFFFYQRNALMAHLYFLPCPSLLPFHMFFWNSVGPLQCCFWTWWLRKQPSLNHWLQAAGCGWLAVKGYHVRAFYKKDSC